VILSIYILGYIATVAVLLKWTVIPTFGVVFASIFWPFVWLVIVGENICNWADAKRGVWQYWGPR
jgi:hypothetical protein